MFKIGHYLLKTIALLILLFVLITGPVLIASSNQIPEIKTPTPTRGIISTQHSSLFPVPLPQPVSEMLGLTLDESN